MPRTINATLEAALASGSYDVYLKVSLIGYDATSLVLSTTNITKYKLTPKDELFVQAVHTYTVDDYNYQKYTRVYIERGVTISGTNYYVRSSLFYIDQIVGDGYTIEVYANRIAKRKLLDTTTSYNDVFTSFDTGNYTLKPATDTIFDNRFYETGAYIQLDNQRELREVVRQKAFIGFTDNGNDKLLYYSARLYENASHFDYDIEVEQLVKSKHKIDPFDALASSLRAHIGLMWVDETGTVGRASGSYANLPVHNIGFLETTGVKPSPNGTNAYISLPILIEKIAIPMNLTYMNGDFVTITSSNNGRSVAGVLQVTEYLDTAKTPAWGLEIELWDFVNG